MEENKHPAEQGKRRSKRINDHDLEQLGKILGTHFVEWYRESYDEDGYFKPSARLPGLREEPMSLIEAQDLAELIKWESKAHTELKQLGNGEWVVIANNMFIWDLKDAELVKA